MLKAILFDFDGVLADTMNDNFLAWKKAYHDFNIEIKESDYFPLEGMKLVEIAKTISHKYNLKTAPEKIVELKNKYYLKNYSFSFYPQTLEIINFLKQKKISLALVSASPKEKLQKTVPEYFLNKFNTIISGDDTSNGKPHPEPYLKAMEKLNLSPKDCIVIENAPLGISSAKNAGAYCIAVTTTLSKDYLSEADIIVDISELKDVLISRYFFYS